MAEGRRRHGRRRPVLAPLCHGPGGSYRLRRLRGAVRRHHERGARPLQGRREHARVRGGRGGRRLRRVACEGGNASSTPAKGWTDITSQCRVSVEGNAFTVRTGDLVAALGGADAFAAGARVVTIYNAPLGDNCNRGAIKGNPNEVYLRYPRSPLADQSGDAGFTRTPSDDACAYTWGLSLIKRSSSDDKPLAGAKLRIIDDRGRILTTDGSWSTDAAAHVTTGADGHVELTGMDAGVYTVEEVAAPKGYAAFEGKRTVTVTAEGLDVKQVTAAKPKVTVSAESLCGLIPPMPGRVRLSCRCSTPQAKKQVEALCPRREIERWCWRRLWLPSEWRLLLSRSSSSGEEVAVKNNCPPLAQWRTASVASDVQAYRPDDHWF